MIKPIPDHYHSITPSFTFKDSRRAIDFYKKAFAAELIDCLPSPDNRGTMHATIQIGNSIIMMGDERDGGEGCAKSAETLGTCPVSFYLYVTDVDAVFKQAVAVGGKPTMPVTDMFWGDRVGQIQDPFGYSWMIATHKHDLSNDEIAAGAKAFFDEMSKQHR